MTTNPTQLLKLSRPDFNVGPWHDDVNDNFAILDAAMKSIGVMSTLKGLWELNTFYEVDDRVVDPDTNSIWTCLVEHTSPSSGSFASYIAANPTHWRAVSQGILPRGNWTPSTKYFVNDLVYADGGALTLGCLQEHISDPTDVYNDIPLGYWFPVFDIRALVADIEADADRAEAAALTAAYSGTSVTSLAIGTGTKAFGAGAGTAGKAWQVGDWVLARDNADPNNKQMYGTITAYDYGTGALTLTVTTIVGSGTIADWLINISGLPGATPIGTGDVTGPVSSVAGRLATFADISGKVIQDSGTLLSALALLASPAFTGNPTVPTQSPGNNTTRAASTAYVVDGIATAILALINGAPAGYDTLAELAAGKWDATVAHALTAKATPVALDEIIILNSAAGYEGRITTMTQLWANFLKALADAVYAPIGASRVVAVFTPLDNQPPTANYATLDTRNSHPVLDFDTTTQETAIFQGRIPPSYSGGGLTVVIAATLTSATSGTLGWDVAFENMLSQDIDSDSFATAKTATAATVPATSGQQQYHTVTFSNSEIDGLAAGDNFRIRLRRDVANDTATGDAEMNSLTVSMT